MRDAAGARRARAHPARRLPQHRPRRAGDAPGLRAEHRDADVQPAGGRARLAARPPAQFAQRRRRASSSACTTSCSSPTTRWRVTGGRNLGDAYFGNAEQRQLRRPRRAGRRTASCATCRAASTATGTTSAPTRCSRWSRAKSCDDDSRQATRVGGRRRTPRRTPMPAAPDRDPTPRPAPADAGPTPEQRARAWDQKPLDLRTASFVWAPAVVLADKPGKIAADRTPTTPARRAALGLAAPARRPDGRASAGDARAPRATTSVGSRRDRGRWPAAADRPGAARTC